MEKAFKPEASRQKALHTARSAIIAEVDLQYPCYLPVFQCVATTSMEAVFAPHGVIFLRGRPAGLHRNYLMYCNGQPWR